MKICEAHCKSLWDTEIPQAVIPRGTLKLPGVSRNFLGYIETLLVHLAFLGMHRNFLVYVEAPWGMLKLLGYVEFSGVH
jgi:hypothetical protein